MPTREIDEPFRVTTTEGVFVRGFADKAQAESSATERNAAAKVLGIQGRYEVREI